MAIVNNTMYIVTPYPNIVYALDLTQGGVVKWKYEPKPASQSQGVACCDVVNRGVTYSNDRIFSTRSTTTPSLWLHRGHALRRNERADVCPSGWKSRQVEQGGAA
ncbi:MAG TPA: hypothetical protein VFS77_20920 [Pyrinomonadaceae bacterium]|nr:hypothetical protein [Pyrinomonadaceae bacterium]